MKHPNWNMDENANYERLAQNCHDPRDRELAYTAVQEMYLARKAQEKAAAREERISKAIGMMAEGIKELEDILGINIRKIAAASFEKRMDEMFPERKAQ